jgi:hypothetical protein
MDNANIVDKIMADFIGNCLTGKNSFTEDASNAVLVVDESEKQDIAIVELFNPVYNVVLLS